MICPNCGTQIPDDVLVCPACHFDLGRTTTLTRLSGQWCKTCGALIPDGADVCPVCGMPAPRAIRKLEKEERSGRAAAPSPAAPQAPSFKVNEKLAALVPQIGEACDDAEESSAGELEQEKAQTHVMARIESAIPSETGAYDDGIQHEGMPRTRIMVVASVAALALVGGVVLWITHPWNPEAFSTKATTPADTSMAGFPGEKQTLSQDQGSQQESSVSGDEYSYQQLKTFWEQLGTLSSSLDGNEQTFRQVATSGDASARADGKSQADGFGIQISNLIDQIADVDTTSGTYADEKKRLQTLGSYLRNRSDALGKAWKLSVDAQDPAAEAASITAPVDGDAASYKRLFDQDYQDAEPQEPSS